MSVATDAWREAVAAVETGLWDESTVALANRGDTLAAILDRIEREVVGCIAQEDDISTGWLLRIIRGEGA